MNDDSLPVLPHHKLIAFGVAKDLLVAVRAAEIRDAKLRDEATRAAKGACLNCAEGAGRVTRPDKARAFTIARGEAVEAAAAVEIAALCGDASQASALAVARIADRLVALLTASSDVERRLPNRSGLRWWTPPLYGVGDAGGTFTALACAFFGRSSRRCSSLISFRSPSNLARLLLERGDGEAGVAVQIDHTLGFVDTRARRDVLDDEAQPAALVRRVPLVVEARERDLAHRVFGRSQVFVVAGIRYRV